MLRGYQAKLHVEENVCPKFCRARPLPLAMKPLVEEELENLVNQKILEPVAFAEWATPIVPILKKDQQSVRICGDFKVTVNQVTKLDRYPIPRAEDLFATLAGGKSFTKLDLSKAYQQVCVDEDTKKLLVVNTHRGLFRYNRLPFGISSAPGVFQRIMESLLQGIPKTVVYIDDILITGESDEAHLFSLQEVLCRLQKAGLRLQRKKCTFMSPEVEYLGYRIDAEGLHPVTKKVEAVQSAPRPTNVSSLKSYLGLLSYYAKFLPNLSHQLAPLNQLLKKCCLLPASWFILILVKI